MNPSVVIKTNFGDIAVELFPQAAPKSVSNFLQYAFDDFYDNVLFHRVVSNFVIQAGLFNAQGTAKIDAQRPPIELESNNGISNLRGTIGFARTNEFDSATSQFYFNVVNNAALDYRSSQDPGYAVFGQVTSGLNVIDAIASVSVETNSGLPNVPINPVVIRDVVLSPGADRLISLETFVAKDGMVAARLAFSSNQIRFKEMSDGAWAILEVGGWSVAKLVGYKRALLDDKAIGLDINGVSGQAYRVYKAAFNREPDHAGVGFWIAQMDAGMDMVEVAARFIDSPEFRGLYGNNPTNELYLTKVYQNVLGRDPEPDGYNWWLNEIQTNPDKTRAKVLADFSESAENKAGTAQLVGQGVAYDLWLG